MACQARYLLSSLLLAQLCSCTELGKQKLSLRGDTILLAKKLGICYYRGKALDATVYFLSPSGDTLSLENYREGWQDGVQKYWYENGQLQKELQYTMGRKEGLDRGYWPDGKRKYLFQFHNDEYEGLQQEWGSNGKLFRAMRYVKGQEEGEQKMWFENGIIRANYVIIKGRRYGLLGTKNCINAKDSIAKFLRP